jgi:activator of HSP90 ATPase
LASGPEGKGRQGGIFKALKYYVLSWRGGIDFWPEGYYSRVTFWLEKIKVGTRLRFTQSGVPDETYDIWDQGWRDYYWKPMKELLEK